MNQKYLGEIRMADLFDNPMGLDGFEFVEFASPTPGVLEPVFDLLGFTAVAKHRSKNVTLYRQGNINFILNEEKNCYASFFA
ncbi:MAG: 4-hydroxyphenylpyruvate dioxygenase, partial [Enterobacterales bacterium]